MTRGIIPIVRPAGGKIFSALEGAMMPIAIDRDIQKMTSDRMKINCCQRTMKKTCRQP